MRVLAVLTTMLLMSAVTAIEATADEISSIPDWAANGRLAQMRQVAAQERQSQREKDVAYWSPSVEELARLLVIVQTLDCLCYGPAGVPTVPVSLPDAHGKLEVRFLDPEDGVKVVTCDVYTTKSGAKFVLNCLAPKVAPSFHGFLEYQMSTLWIENGKLMCYDPSGRITIYRFDLDEQVDAPAVFGDAAGELQYSSLATYLRDAYQAAQIEERDGNYTPARPLKIVEPHAVTRWQATKGEDGKITEVLAYAHDKEVMKTTLGWRGAAIARAEILWQPGQIQLRREVDEIRKGRSKPQKKVYETSIEFPGQRIVWEFATDSQLSATLPSRATFFRNEVEFAQIRFLGWRGE